MGDRNAQGLEQLIRHPKVLQWARDEVGVDSLFIEPRTFGQPTGATTKGSSSGTVSDPETSYMLKGGMGGQEICIGGILDLVTAVSSFRDAIGYTGQIGQLTYQQLLQQVEVAQEEGARSTSGAHSTRR